MMWNGVHAVYECMNKNKWVTWEMLGMHHLKPAGSWSRPACAMGAERASDAVSAECSQRLLAACPAGPPNS